MTGKRAIEIIFVLAMMLVMIFAELPAEAQEKPSVLILNSYNRDFSWTEDQTQGFIDAGKQAGMDVTYYIEYLDWKNNFTAASLKAQEVLFQVKYNHRKIDLIYTTDDAALEFALAHRRELFSNAPIVFSGVYESTAKSLTKDEQQVAGVYETPDVEGTVKMMLNFNTELQAVYLIYDDTESGLAVKDLLIQAVYKVNPELKVYSLDGSSYQEISKKLQELPDNSAVLMATYTRDRQTTIMPWEEYVKIFSSHSRVPLYTLYDLGMGFGAVGGSVLSGKKHGANAAQLGFEFLAGEKALNIEPVVSSSSAKMVDYRAMERYQLPVARITGDSIVLNKPVSFYDENKYMIRTVMLIFLILVGYILLLTKNIKERKAAEKVLKKNNEELASLYEEVYTSEEALNQQYLELTAIQELLQKSQRRYELAVDGVNDGLWDWDIITNEVYFSERCQAILESTLEDIKNFQDFVRQFVAPNDQEKFTTVLEEHLAGKTAYYICEIRMRTAKGPKWILIRGKAFIDDASRPIRMAGSLTDITLRKQDEERINYLAYCDSLTGLANHAVINDRLNDMLQKCSVGLLGGVMLFLDLDNFKVINDTFGHSYGNEILIQIAQRLTTHHNGLQLIGRMGGDEFVILLEKISDRQDIMHYADGIKNLFVNPFAVGGHLFHVTASVGIVLFPEQGKTAEEIFKNADLAVYQAKNKGKNQYVFFDKVMGESAQKKMLMERSLREALSTSEFTLWYQPQVDVVTNRIAGFEALIRWNSKEYGWVMPLEFIALAEESGLIIPLGQQIIRQACYFIKKLHADGYRELVVTVNISVVQLSQADFISMVREIISETGVEVKSLGFEITESFLMESSEVNIMKLKTLRQMGIAIYLDDFGTGYSSLKYLEALSLDVVKIDKSFVDSLNSEQQDKGLIEVIIHLAHRLGLKTIAEGVESERQLQLLVGYGCDAVQGYLFSKPLPEDKVCDLLQKRYERFYFTK